MSGKKEQFFTGVCAARIGKREDHFYLTTLTIKPIKSFHLIFFP